MTLATVDRSDPARLFPGFGLPIRSAGDLLAEAADRPVDRATAVGPETGVTE